MPAHLQPAMRGLRAQRMPASPFLSYAIKAKCGPIADCNPTTTSKQHFRHAHSHAHNGRPAKTIGGREFQGLDEMPECALFVLLIVS